MHANINCSRPVIMMMLPIVSKKIVTKSYIEIAEFLTAEL